MPSETATAAFQSPIGLITITATQFALVSTRIGKARTAHDRPVLSAGHPVLTTAIEQLTQWFAGERHGFDLSIAAAASPEADLLRAAIASVPYGETRTYGALATQFGSAAQAVGQACKTNPFPIIIPCHRIVSTNGPEFFSGGDGPRTKTWLLDFEYANLPPERRMRLI